MVQLPATAAIEYVAACWVSGAGRIFVRGCFCTGGLLTGGLFPRGSFARGHFWPGWFLSGGAFARGSFARGDFCPGAYAFCHQSSANNDSRERCHRLANADALKTHERVNAFNLVCNMIYPTGKRCRTWIVNGLQLNARLYRAGLLALQSFLYNLSHASRIL